MCIPFLPVVFVSKISQVHPRPSEEEKAVVLLWPATLLVCVYHCGLLRQQKQLALRERV